MRKITNKTKCSLLIFITIVFLLTGSVQTDSYTPAVAEETVENENSVTDIVKDQGKCENEPLCSEDETEESINSASLDEDVRLTDSAKANNGTENATIVTDNGTGGANGNSSKAPGLINVTRVFDTRIPGSIVKNLKYTQYKVTNDYLLVLKDTANIRQFPSPTAKIIGTAKYFEKITLAAEVKGQYSDKYKTDIWYEVLFNTGKEANRGYVLKPLVEIRTFQFEKMIGAVSALKNEVDENITAYISNYKNRNGMPPYYSGKSVDAYGAKRDQSAPAYIKASFEGDFRYISDGTLVSVIAETGSFYKIKTLNFTGEYYVPKKFVSFRESVDKLTKVIVVDRKNQNEGIFEYIDDKWNLISYTYATTGDNSNYKQPTNLGFYMAIQKVDRFLYLDDVTRELQGYAPYAIRFNGGAYVHGVPVDLTVKNGVKVYPPMQEYLFTIGTVPRSHKCVRNYTSHAKFLHGWAEIGKTAVIVIE